MPRSQSSDSPRPRRSDGGGRKTRAAEPAWKKDQRGEYTATPSAPARKGWGSVARKGAAGIKEEGPGRPSSREAERVERPRDVDDERWVRDEKPRRTGTKRPPRSKFVLPDDAIKEIEKRAGKRADRLLRYLGEAGAAYAAERWSDARKALRPLLQEVPDAPVVREMFGMVLYRTNKWAAAIKELQAAHLATQSFDLYPAIMDCHRALGQYKQVDQLWDELRKASPGAEVVAEGRIVAAGSLADRDRVADGIRLLEKAPRTRNEPKDHHLRTWYALADLYDRAGEAGKARTLFEKVAKYDDELGDVLGRLAALD